MIVYISGGITGVKNFKERFAEAEAYLKKLGHEPINPALVELPKSCTWGDYMKIDLEMLNLADGIYMLSNWKESKGARLEFDYAIANDLKILFETDERGI